MKEEISTVVRIPLSCVEKDIRERFSITLDLLSVSLEKDAVILRFGSQAVPPSDQAEHEEKSSESSSQAVTESHFAEIKSSTASGTHMIEISPRERRRRRPSKRNRMKTRGWKIVTKMINSKGQTVRIYEPFVQALRGKRMSRRQMERAVAAVLRENGNRPGPASIDYYLSNTLEYLAKEGNG